MAYRPGKGSWNNKGSWKPSVRAPRGGQPCKHERHAQFALRSVLHHYDFMAAMYARENGGERFTYIGMSYLLRHCQDIETKQPYSRSMLEKCVSFARENGIIFPAERYVKRVGEKKQGHTVIEHAAVSQIVGSRCVFCGANSAANSASDSAKDSAADSAQNGQRTPHFDVERTPQANEVKTHETQGLSESGNGNLPSAKTAILPFSKSLVSHLEGLEGLESSALCHQPLTSGDLTGKVCPGVKVGDLSRLKLEEQLDMLTDGEFHTTSLEKYRDIRALQTVVQRTIAEYGSTVIRNRADCKKLCERINDALRNSGVQPPSGWVPTLKALKSGNARQHKPPVIPPSIQEREAANPRHYLTAEEKRKIEEKVNEECNRAAMRAAGFAL